VPRFTQAQLEAFRDAEVPDLVGPRPRLVFVGINPGLWTAAVSSHFARPGNRFYPALLAAGIIDRPINPSAGMSEDDRATLVDRGIAITNLVRRATARADELSRAELVAGRQELEEFAVRHRPRVVAVLGITAYRVAFERPRAKPGRQDAVIGDAELWALPNPSGLNAHATIATLATSYAEAARAAGIELSRPAAVGDS
jgi:double-stranded uracil-DNA glycosylase